MSTPGMWEIIFLAFLALLIFGPDRLPGMARSVGTTIAKVKREAQVTLEELKLTAEVQEMRDIAGELKGTTADLKRSAALTGPVASAASAADVTSSVGSAGAGQSTAQANMPAPFDPDAT
jgi:sec-independent protein translocase protein TatB